MQPEVEKNLSELTLSSSNSDDYNDDNNDSSGSRSPNQSIVNGDSIQSIKKSKGEDSFTRKKRVHKETKFAIYLNVAIITFVNYLLLVYLPSGVGPSLIGMLILTGIVLRAQILDDARRKRWDRISAVLTMLIFMASFLSLCTYARIGTKEGGVYEGKARIVGYDATNYNDGSKGGDGASSATASGAVRTDLEVEWGGQWGCPDTPDKQCHADVSGALCEANDSNYRKQRRHRNRNRALKMDTTIEENEETKEYYTEVKELEDEYADEVEDAVLEEAESEDLEAVEELQEAEDEVQEYANDTEQTIDNLESDLQTDQDKVDSDLDNVKSAVLEGSDDPDGSIENSIINDATADVQAMEDKIAELEKEVAVLEEANAEGKEIDEITELDEEYYAENAEDEEEENEDLLDENEDLAIDEEYYAEVADEEADEVESLEDANEDLSEETEELEDEVDEVIGYYQEKEKNQPVETDIITKTYYPVNATNTTGDYYVYATEEVVMSNPNSYESSMDDDYAYSFEDDYFEDEYWDYNWDSAWGDYACNDLFDTDLESIEYDENEAPGNDDFPYVKIYGTCNSCKAFLVDYYSTAHFDKIKEYQRHAKTYAIFGILSMFVTGGFMVKQHVSPARENQIDLLMSEGGGYERQLV